jgi:hypothetical protein
MEIWPVGHYSPIHNHANASAIIVEVQKDTLIAPIYVVEYPEDKNRLKSTYYAGNVDTEGLLDLK